MASPAGGAAFSVGAQAMAGGGAPSSGAHASAHISLSAAVDREVITCDSLPAVGSAEFNDLMAKAQKASEEIKVEVKQSKKQ